MKLNFCLYLSMILAFEATGLVFPSVTHAQSGWYWQNPTPQGNAIECMSFLNSDVGVAAGEFGTIIKTTDDGKTWQEDVLGSARQYYAMFFIDSLTGIIVGGGGTILKTTDGGQSWTTQMSDHYFLLTSVDFLNSNLGMATGWYGLILRTTDGGESWAEMPSSTKFDLTGIKILSPSFAIAVGQGNCCPTDGIILRTTDGGTSWSVVLSGSAVGGFSAVGLNGTILQTINGGANWTSQTSNTGRNLFGVFCQTSEKAIAVGDGSTILRTVNGGESPPIIASPPQQILLAQNYPNPFNPFTIIEYDLPLSMHVRLTVFDILGREVLRLVDEFQQAGRKSVTLHDNDLPSGVYFYRLQAGSFTETKKLVLLR